MYTRFSNQWVILLPLVAILLASFLFYWYNPRNIAVTIDANGFHPSTLHIKPGSKALWVNEDRYPHWPASNNHPTHGMYPEEGGCIGSMLDACRGLEKGQSYSFVFDKEGSWEMHDHLAPGLTMTVIVGEVSLNDDRFSQQAIIVNFAKQNPNAARSELKRLSLANNAPANVHELSHLIGNEAYKKFGVKGVAVCDDAFGFGCYHGVTEEMLKQEGKESIRVAQSACLEQFPPEKKMRRASCIHGIGHGILSWEQFDLSRALQDCDALDNEFRSYCYDGVFMEWSSGIRREHINEKNPWATCTDLDPLYQLSCARYQKDLFVRLGFDHMRLGQICLQAPEEVLRDTCAQHVGYHIAQQQKGDATKIYRSCQELPEIIQASCVSASAREVIFETYPDWQGASLWLCEQLPSMQKQQCLLEREETINAYRL